MTSYLSTSEADAIAATMIPAMVAAYTAAEPAARASALEQASADIDACWRWQGRRYDPLQGLEFPRIPWPDQAIVWDQVEQEVVVPAAVLRAVVLQAADRLDGTRLGALLARDGLTSMTTASLSEAYAAGSAMATQIVTPAARGLLSRFRLSGGGLR